MHYDDIYRDMANTIRERICLADPNENYVLREPALAQEFGVSRTPVRQILQALAVENLVETRPGFGTIATRMNPEDRQAHFCAYSQMAMAAANCAMRLDTPIGDEAKVKFMGLSTLVQSETEPSARGMVRASRSLIEATTSLVEDEIIRAALAAAHWRLLRWRVREMIVSPETTWESFAKNISYAAESLSSKKAHAMLTTISGISTAVGEL